MEVNKEMDRLHETVQQHSVEITQLKMDALQRDHKIDLLTAKVDGMNLQFSELKNTVQAEGSKSREEMSKVTDRLWSHIEKMEAYDQAAAERGDELRKTKLQIFKEIMVGLFAATGTILAGSLGFQEIVRLFQ
ncbi:hypothetical protein C0431_15455 [bacterium]|nr:hypothetical protein [bacterium]